MLFSLLVVSAQKGDELLVYSLTGNITVVENNQESKLKIGKVLKPGATIKTQPQAKLTMVCKQGKPISVTREGIFPVDNWKDSCETEGNSVTTKYFQYIWDQLYVRSDDYKKNNPTVESTPDAPIRGQEELELFPNHNIDTLKYVRGEFPFTWKTSKPYDGRYFFRLYNARTKRVVFSDSIKGNWIPIDWFKRFMKKSRTYYWTLSTTKTEEVEGSFIKFLPEITLNNLLTRLKKLNFEGEDPAARFFRMAYMLEQEKFFGEARIYYQKASNAQGEQGLFREKMIEFDRRFGYYGNDF